MDQVGSELGNTKLARTPLSKHYMFTIKYDLITKDQLSHILSPLCSKIAVQSEVGEGGYKHWQGYVCFKDKCRPIEKKLLPVETHWEKCRDHKRSELYCLKNDTFAGERLTLNCRPPPRPLASISLEARGLRPWQRATIELVKGYADESDRSIIWIVDELGNSGKTYLAKALYDNRSCLMVSGGSKDICCALASFMEERGEGPDIFIWNLPRDNSCISYSSLESLKDGFVFSPKYKSCCLRFNTPHVIVFSNEYPDIDKLSMDRWKIFRIEGGDSPLVAVVPSSLRHSELVSV